MTVAPHIRWILCLLIGLAATPVLGATFYDAPAADPNIPRPEVFLGYELGERFTPHHQVVAYLETLARSSSRIELRRYGQTYEGRPLLLTVSDPTNLAKQDEIRTTYAELADPRITSEGEARARSRDLPVAVWLSFNIHGNETSSSESAMALAYYLAASGDPAVSQMLREVVVLIDPCLNPDGRDRYVNWFNSVQGSRPDPDRVTREHEEPWPGGRYNHYLFDLNRDWAWLTQRESRERALAYVSWRPQVHVDFHEMWAEATYFFFPPERPVHEGFPDQVMKWARIFGEGNAAAFDARGWRYYTAESFDLFYPGYGDSWPTFHGAIGMTYEQAGHGTSGLSYQRRDDTLLTLQDRTEHHYVAALATLQTAATNREARLLDFHRFFQSGPRREARTYVFPPSDDPPRTAQLVGLLLDHGVEVFRTTKTLSSRGLVSYEGPGADGDLPPGTFVVPGDQPLHRFVHAVLEPEAALPDTMFYDVSAWSLPLAFGVPAYWTRNNVSVDMDRVLEAPSREGDVLRQGTYAYLISWSRNGAPHAAALLQTRGVRVHFAMRPVTIDGESYPAGSLVVFTEGNGEDLAAHLDEVAALSGVDVVGVDSGLTEAGPDLGSSRVRYLKPSRVAILSGDPVAPTSFGACWYLLDRMFEINHSVITIDAVSASGLAKFDVLVFPDDYRGGYAYGAAFDEGQIDALREWIRAGGVLVGLGGGALFATESRSGLSSVAILDPDEDLEKDELEEREQRRRLETVEQRERRHRHEDVPGTIFRVSVDPLHPLGFGYEGTARVLKTSTTVLELGPEGTNVAVYPADPRVSGYASAENVDRVVDTPFLVDEPLGRGHVVLYADDPNFRLFWYGLNRLFLNSLIFLPSLN